MRCPRCCPRFPLQCSPLGPTARFESRFCCGLGSVLLRAYFNTAPCSQRRRRAKLRCNFAFNTAKPELSRASDNASALLWLTNRTRNGACAAQLTRWTPTHAYRSTTAAYALWHAEVSASARRLHTTADRPAKASRERAVAAAPENKAAPPHQKQGTAKPHHHLQTMDTFMSFANAAPCATKCNFCSQCVHYRTNVRIQQRRERQERDRRRGIAPPPPPEPAPSPEPDPPESPRRPASLAFPDAA